jgi:predicted lipoprotein
MKKSMLFLIWTILFNLGCSNSPKVPSENTPFDVPQFLAEVNENIIIPTLKDFDDEAQKLNALTVGYVNETTVDRLEILRKQWIKTAIAYEKTYNFHIGEAKSRFINLAINNWPTVPHSIEQLIKKNEINDAIINAISPQIKGIPAIEYLLFGKNSSKTNADFNKSPKRKKYLKFAVEFIKNQAHRLLNIWITEGRNYSKTFVENNGSGIKESFNLLFNGLYNSVNTSKITKIGKPAGLENSPRANPNLVQAPYSHQSLALLKGSIEVIEAVFFTDEHANIAQYISSISKDNLVNDRIKKAIFESYQAIDAIPVPLEEAVASHPEAVANLHDKLAALNVWIAVDARNILSVIITSTDTDGD